MGQAKKYIFVDHSFPAVILLFIILRPKMFLCENLEASDPQSSTSGS